MLKNHSERVQRYSYNLYKNIDLLLVGDILFNESLAKLNAAFLEKLRRILTVFNEGGVDSM